MRGIVINQFFFVFEISVYFFSFNLVKLLSHNINGPGIVVCFETFLKVRTYECDSYGHVNNATFLNYCEFARVEFLQKLGYNLDNLKQKGFVLPIVKIEIEYKIPVFANDELRITVEWKSRGKSSSVFQQEIYRKSDTVLIARAYVTWVITDLKGKPIEIPLELLDSFKSMFGELPPIKTTK